MRLVKFILLIAIELGISKERLKELIKKACDTGKKVDFAADQEIFEICKMIDEILERSL